MIPHLLRLVTYRILFSESPPGERTIVSAAVGAAHSVGGQIQRGDAGGGFDVAEAVIAPRIDGQVEIVVGAEIAHELRAFPGENHRGDVVERASRKLEIVQLLHAQGRIVRLEQERGDGVQIVELLEHREIIGAPIVNHLVVEQDRAGVFDNRRTGDRLDIVGGRDDEVAVEFLEDRGKRDFLAGAVTHTENAFEARDAITAIDQVEAEVCFSAGDVEGLFGLNRSLGVDGLAFAGVGIAIDDQISDVALFLAVDHEIRTLPVFVREEDFRCDGDCRRQKDHRRIRTDDGGDVNHRPRVLGRLTIAAGDIVPEELGVAGDGEKDDVGFMTDVEALRRRAVFTRETDEKADIVTKREAERTDPADEVTIRFRASRDDHRDHTAVDLERVEIQSTVVLVDHRLDGVENGGGADVGEFVGRFVDDVALDDPDAFHAGMLMEGGDDFVGLVGDRAIRKAGAVGENQGDAVGTFPGIDDLSIDSARDDRFNLHADAAAFCDEVFDVFPLIRVIARRHLTGLDGLRERLSSGNGAFVLSILGRGIHGRRRNIGSRN